MNRAVTTSIVIALAVAAGCRDTTSPPPQRVPVPESEPRTYREADPVKPLPPPREPMDDSAVAAAPFDDPPLVSQRPPEQRAFVDAYTRVGRPRITVFVNRTLDGQIIPVKPDDPFTSVEHEQRSSTGNQTQDSRETMDDYLPPGQYDQLNARTIDYIAVENVLASWIASSGQVTLVSPVLAQRTLDDRTVTELNEGRPQVLSAVAEQLGADVLIQVQARPTRQTPAGLHVRLIAEAMNTRGGQSLGRAMVDIPPPLDKPQINEYTRFLARKLMDDMIGTWEATPAAQRVAPTTAPNH